VGVKAKGGKGYHNEDELKKKMRDRTGRKENAEQNERRETGVGRTSKSVTDLMEEKNSDIVSHRGMIVKKTQGRRALLSPKEDTGRPWEETVLFVTEERRRPKESTTGGLRRDGSNTGGGSSEHSRYNHYWKRREP